LALPSNLYCIYLGVAIQLLTQWCGPQSITVYAPDFFLIAGVSGQEEKLFASCILGVVKLIGGLLCAFFLVDFIGRKRSIVIGITIQATAMAYLAIYLSVVGTPGPTAFTSAQKSASLGAIAMIYIASFVSILHSQTEHRAILIPSSRGMGTGLERDPVPAQRGDLPTTYPRTVLVDHDDLTFRQPVRSKQGGSTDVATCRRGRHGSGWSLLVFRNPDAYRHGMGMVFHP